MGDRPAHVAYNETLAHLRDIDRALAAEKGQQLIVVTHHPEAIDYMAADAVWRMWRDEADGRACIEQLQPDRSAGETAYDLVKFGALKDTNGSEG